MDVDIKKKLENFDLDMNFSTEGGCLGILGASGCGKSMTLKSIAGIITPDSGQIKTEKKILYDSEKKMNLRPQDRKVGYLFQNYALFPNMTVGENIAAGIIGGAKKRMTRKKIAELTDFYIQKFHLEGLKDQYPSRLSGGQQQRTALARIFASKPDVMLLDEPFSALDSYLREELQIELKERLKSFEGCTILVSHDRDEIYKLCDRTMIVENGKNIICEDTKELFDNPKHMIAARLTGCKNISRAKQISDHRIYAQDWGVELYVDKEISKRLSYIGIRAHDFIPVEKNENEQTNVIQILPFDRIETPFEQTLLFKNSVSPKEMMWMKQKKGCKVVPDRVKVDPKKILLLEE